MKETARRYREQARSLNAEADKIDPPNVKLQELYVNWGMHHLMAIDECIERLGEFSNINMMDAQNSLFEAKRRLIEGNPDYQEAAWKLAAGYEPTPYHERVERSTPLQGERPEPVSDQDLADKIAEDLDDTIQVFVFGVDEPFPGFGPHGG